MTATHEISNLETVSISATSRLEQQHSNYMTVDNYVLYSKLNVSNTSLNIFRFYLIAILKATTDSLPKILKVN